MNPKAVAVLGLTLLGMAGGAAVLLRSWPIINVVETGQTPEYPDVIPRMYQARGEQVFDAALHAVNRLPRWSLVGRSEDQGEIRAEATTRVLRFVDDVDIHIAERAQGTIVHVRSASRVGRGDFGQNARNIRVFFQELDSQMGKRSTH
ncbi:MAG TPA: DUF1499 domain-containing protein [Nitrospiraceae bacterium]|nr:DUF1499 domain-containing protein [Nitrospiraceae bacterium]